ncbi:MAG: hypothetical protein RSF33_01755 [Hydrogenoanaerobacterium sp.]
MANCQMQNCLPLRHGGIRHSGIRRSYQMQTACRYDTAGYGG